MLQLRSRGSGVEISAAATLLQPCCKQLSSYTETETTRRWQSYRPLFPVAGKEINWGKDLLEKSLSTLWTIGSCALSSSLKSVPGCQNSSQHKLPGLFFFFFFFLINSTDWFCFAGLILLLKFVEGLWSSCVLSFVSEASMTFYFLWFSPYVVSGVSLLHI